MESWEQKYVSTHTPNFLKPLEGLILSTGKYLNVISDCGLNAHFPEAQKVFIFIHFFSFFFFQKKKLTKLLDFFCFI